MLSRRRPRVSPPQVDPDLPASSGFAGGALAPAFQAELAERHRLAPRAIEALRRTRTPAESSPAPGPIRPGEQAPVPALAPVEAPSSSPALPTGPEGAAELENENLWHALVDGAVGKAQGVIDGAAGLVEDVPLLGDFASNMAPISKFSWGILGGAAKGMGDMVMNTAWLATHPGQALSGIGQMVYHSPLSPHRMLGRAVDVFSGETSLEESGLLHPIDTWKNDVKGDMAFWGEVWNGIAAPYAEAIEEGDYADAIGRGLFDIGSLLIPATKAGLAGKGLSTGARASKAASTLAVETGKTLATSAIAPASKATAAG